jgi:hypothetical protein
VLLAAIAGHAPMPITAGEIPVMPGFIPIIPGPIPATAIPARAARTITPSPTLIARFISLTSLGVQHQECQPAERTALL